MSEQQPDYAHNFLGTGHEAAERRTWWVIGLCTFMMLAEIIGGWAFGSLALVADGLHMSTHAGALLLAAMAYTLARKHKTDPRFSFGTGKFGDLAGYTSAIILAAIALLIFYEALNRLFHPVNIAFNQAIPIAALGLAVNLASAWLLSGGHHHHHHGHGHDHDDHDHDDHDHDHHDDHDHGHHGHHVAIGRDNNLRAALIHVAADAAVSVLVIVGLVLARAYHWLFMDPLVGIVGALVIASWALGLVRDTGRILLDMTPDQTLAARLRAVVDADDELLDLHLWRVGPGHLAAILTVKSASPTRDCAYYRARASQIGPLSHLNIEVLMSA
ncbi:CDF family Co(II)/Ni(II) efflux transporter DmeF [Acidocella sp.]|uniref:CDF family Co(II)/Ni(II) efflux transporter DmeF n=1 Tax=Acidocella sp. TaxID=50710 RepID=UPI00262CDB82|nr:CDF family Co(II)/Ni(II) efflux transporter DmeF [Acidocella sp.]